MPAENVSHYRIVREIGSGGMGVVYRADDVKLGRPVALKFLPKDLTRTPQAIDRFRREARATSALNHPHICTIYDIDEDQGQPFIAMELLEGETLRERIARGPLPLDEAVRIAAQIADALDAAHNRGIIHRDIKPANIFITARGTAKVLDFGLAKLADIDVGSSLTLGGLTETGTSLGTVAYMSPEQARGEDVDARTDLFSLGAVLYEMTTGRPMFTGPTPAIIFDAILNKQPAAPSSVNPKVPLPFQTIIQKLTVKDRYSRYAAATHVREDLLKLDLAPSPGKHSIAVLPFSDLSPQRDQEYFCDGMAEELINALTKVDSLQVASRTSSFQFKGKNEDIRGIGEKLAVECVLEGSVRKAGNRLRITAQLIKVADGYHLWSDKFDRDMDDIFAVQDEIAGTIVQTLRSKLGGSTEADKPIIKLVRRYTDNVQAYNLYLQGRHFWMRRYIGLMWKGIDCYKKAIELDSEYTLAYTGLVEAYYVLGLYGIVLPVEAYANAKLYADKAERLDDQLSEVHFSQGLVKLCFEWNVHGATESMGRALLLNPNHALALSYKAFVSSLLLREDDLVEFADKAMELEPCSGFIVSVAIFGYLGLGKIDLALNASQKSIDVDPDHVVARYFRGLLLLRTGAFDEAIQNLEKAVMTIGRIPFTLGLLGYGYGMAGRTADARNILAELEGSLPTQYVAPIFLAWVYLGIGESGQALEHLEQSLINRDPWLLFAIRLPMYDPIRNHPRFESIVRSMNLPL